MLGSESPLARLPVALDLRQRRWLLGLRYAFDVLGASAMRLTSTLYMLAFEKDLAGVAKVSLADPFAVALTDAWSVIDAAWRLKRFLIDGRLPNSDKRHMPLEHKLACRVFEAEVRGLKTMRNGFQHLDAHVLEEASAERPIWGTLRWVALHPDRHSMETCVLAAGTIEKQDSHTFVNPLGLPFHGQVDHISLDAFGETAHLSRIARAAKDVLRSFEAILAPQFADHPSGMGDCLIRVTITLGH